MPDLNDLRPGETSSIGEGVFSSEAVETAPQESAVPSAQETGTQADTLSLWLGEPGVGGISSGGWAGLGLGAGLLLSAAAVLIRKAVGQRGEKRPLALPLEPPDSGRVRVDKLHEQGARSGQQDCFYVSCEGDWISDVVILNGAPGLLAVVADGMGGLADGDKVSQTAVSAIAQGFHQAQGTPQQVLLQLAERANMAVNQLLGEDGLYHSGSTLVAGLLREGAFHYLSIGDSRICLYRKGVLYQLNREHIYQNELSVRFVNGEESLENVAGHPKAAGLTSFLGMGQLKYIDLPAEPVQVRRGDQFILMSDGVYNALTPEELSAALERGAGQAARALDEAIRAKNYQNQDNYTAVILTC